MTLERDLRHTIPSERVFRAIRVHRARTRDPRQPFNIAAWLAHVYDLILGREPGSGKAA